MKIKEGGVMDIHKELLAYEQSLQDNGFFKVENIGMCTVFDPEQNKYHPSDLCDPKEYKFIDMLNVGWTAWQAAKANAVPEGFVLVEKPLLSDIHESCVACLEIVSDKSIYKSLLMTIRDEVAPLIEAQEPANADTSS